MHNSEQEFLKSYDPDKFEKLSMTADVLIFSVSDGGKEDYRKLNQKMFSMLLVKRENYPFKDKWCLPGGFVGIKESLDDAATRILQSETNLENIYMEQLYTFGSVERDPRMRVVSTAYMALVDKNKVEGKLSDNAAWFNVEDDSLYNEKESIAIGELTFDHGEVVQIGRERLKNKIEYTDIVFNMMPEYFTLGELQQVYEIILGKKLLDPAFRRIIAHKVEKTEMWRRGGGHRPAVMYKRRET